MMDKFRAQSIRFGTRIITETISKIDLSERPFKYWREGQESEEPETTDTVIIATGASAKRMGLKGEDTYWQSGISACAVCDGAVPIFRCGCHVLNYHHVVELEQAETTRCHWRWRFSCRGSDL